MSDEGLDRGNPHVEENLERVRNRIYRGILNEDVGISPDDFEDLPGAFEYLTEEESERLGGLSLKIETEGREGVDFEEITDLEREYFEVLIRGLNRYKSEE